MEDNLVDSFMNEANADDYSDSISGNMDEVEVKELQASLNLLGFMLKKAMPAPQIEVDGVMGPKTYARFKQFYKMLPERTQKLLNYSDLPIAELDDKDIKL
tara:strand:+ start:172 stop:474 length:303 start_codon:yes stop_codon:yes gene_type:complete